MKLFSSVSISRSGSGADHNSIYHETSPASRSGTVSQRGRNQSLPNPASSFFLRLFNCFDVRLFDCFPVPSYFPVPCSSVLTFRGKTKVFTLIELPMRKVCKRFASPPQQQDKKQIPFRAADHAFPLSIKDNDKVKYSLREHLKNITQRTSLNLNSELCHDENGFQLRGASPPP